MLKKFHCFINGEHVADVFSEDEYDGLRYIEKKFLSVHPEKYVDCEIIIGDLDEIKQHKLVLKKNIHSVYLVREESVSRWKKLFSNFETL